MERPLHHRLERALATFDHRDQVQVVQRSLPIDPDAAAGRGQGPHHRSGPPHVRRRHGGRGLEGLAYDFAAARHTSAPSGGHRLLHWAADAMIDRLLSGYLQRGE